MTNMYDYGRLEEKREEINRKVHDSHFDELTAYVEFIHYVNKITTESLYNKALVGLTLNMKNLKIAIAVSHQVNQTDMVTLYRYSYPDTVIINIAPIMFESENTIYDKMVELAYAVVCGIYTANAYQLTGMPSEILSVEMSAKSLAYDFLVDSLLESIANDSKKPAEKFYGCKVFKRIQYANTIFSSDQSMREILSNTSDLIKTAFEYDVTTAKDHLFNIVYRLSNTNLDQDVVEKFEELEEDDDGVVVLLYEDAKFIVFDNTRKIISTIKSFNKWVRDNIMPNIYNVYVGRVLYKIDGKTLYIKFQDVKEYEYTGFCSVLLEAKKKEQKEDD